MQSPSPSFPRSTWQVVPRRLSLWVLLGAGALSVLCYLWFFVRPFGLLDLAHRPLLDLFKLSQSQPAARQQVIAGYVILGGLYWLGWRAAQQVAQENRRAAWIIVVATAMAAGAALLLMYPFGAADIFDNIMHGRILGVHNANPFADIPAQFANDAIYPYSAWRRVASAYGPAWEMLAGGVAWLVHQTLGISETPKVSIVIANAVAFKLLSGVFLAASAAVVAVILRRKAPERALAGVVLLAWNPVILVETVGNGHNDIAMIFWVLAAAWALVGGRYTLAVLALVAGALFKFVPVLMLPAALLIALREINARQQSSKVRQIRLRNTQYAIRPIPLLRFLLLTGVASVALILLFYAPFWQGLETLSIERRQALFTASLPAALWAALQEPWGRTLAAERVSLSAAGLTALFALWQGWRAYREGQLAGLHPGIVQYSDVLSVGHLPLVSELVCSLAAGAGGAVAPRPCCAPGRAVRLRCLGQAAGVRAAVAVAAPPAAQDVARAASWPGADGPADPLHAGGVDG